MLCTVAQRDVAQAGPGDLTMTLWALATIKHTSQTKVGDDRLMTLTEAQ